MISCSAVHSSRVRLCDPFHATSLSVKVPKDSPSQEAAETLSYSPRRKSLESLTPFCPGQNVRFTCARNRFANIFPPLDFLLSIVVSIIMKRNRKGAASRLRAVTAHGTYRRPASVRPAPFPQPLPLRALFTHVYSFVNQATGSSITCLGSYFWYEVELGVQPSSFGLRASLTLSDIQPGLPKQRADQAFSGTVH